MKDTDEQSGETIQASGAASSLTRRRFIQSVVFSTAGLLASCQRGVEKAGSAGGGKKRPVIQTVNGEMAADDMGFTLPHEHVIVDWNGMDGKSRERYDPAEVVTVIKPLLDDVRKLGVRTFADCTPQYLGRNVNLLSTLSRATGLNILTCTGLHEKTHWPKFAFEASVEELTNMMIRDFEDGIDGTGIRPGFIKIGVSNEGPVTPNDEKILTAACRASRATGATINSHTFQGASAMREIEILEHEGVDPASFVYVHACFEPEVSYTLEAAKRGVWIEFDSIRADRADFHLQRILIMIDKGYERQLLLSQDRGWYTVGEKSGGKINDYSYLPKTFLPLLASKGVTSAQIYTMTVTNPASTFAFKK